MAPLIPRDRSVLTLLTVIVVAAAIAGCSSGTGSAGSSGSSPSACIPAFCDKRYTCAPIQSADGSTGSPLTVEFTSASGACVPSPGNIVYHCDGSMTNESQAVGSWTLSGSVLTACTTKTVGGSCLRCTPQ